MARRKFNREFKLSVLAELDTASLTEVCRKHSLHPSTVIGWRKDYETAPQDAFAGSGKRWKPEAELEHYKRLVGELYAQIELLKKAYNHQVALRAEQKRLERRDLP